MSDFNMVNNGRFARNSTNGVNDWNHVNLVASDTTVTDSERGSCLRITGEPDKEKRVLQGIYAKGGEGDVFRFGCFAKAEAIPGKTFRIAAAVIYADGTHKWENVDFDPYRSGWQYVSGVVSTDDEDSVTNKQYTAVHLYIMYDNQMNPGYFTDVQFIKDDSWSYTYDSKGNLNTAKKTHEKNFVFFTRLCLYCSICLPINPAAHFASAFSVSPILTLRSFPERITEPIASPPQRIGVITCGTSGLLSPLVSST